MRFPRMAMSAKQDSSSVVGSENGSTETAVSDRGYNLPNSRRVYITGNEHADVRVPFREISRAPTKDFDGRLETNEPIRVYDTSGPWGDPDINVDVARGLPALRGKWIRDRGDVEEYAGRAVRPIDDGYLSDVHAHAPQKRSTPNPPSPEATARQAPNGGNGSSSFAARKPLRARSGTAVTHLAYARRGIITREMEFIAIRENHSAIRIPQSEIARNDLRHHHAGSEPIENRK